MDSNSDLIPRALDWMDAAFEDEGPTNVVRTHSFKVHRNVSIDGDMLVYRGTQPGEFDLKEPPTRGQDSLRLLNRFLKLGRAKLVGREPNPAQILRIASTWGPLGFCPHSLPGSCAECGSRTERLFLGSAEPTSVWVDYSVRAMAILDLHQRLCSSSDALSRHDFAALVSKIDPLTPGRNRLAMRQDLHVVQHYINGWLRDADVGLRVDWDRSAKLKMEVDADLFGWLGLQLAAAVAGSAGVAICSACALPYFPARAPNPSRDNYCNDPGCKREAKNSSYRARGKGRQREQIRKKEGRHGEAS